MKLTKDVLDAIKMAKSYVSLECDVGPEAAQELLKLNIGNRPIRQNTVQSYARAMKAGEWYFTAEPMTILDGVLISGQKRCLAIIQSGATIRMVIAAGVHPKSRLVIDSGDRRKLLDWSGLRPDVQKVLTAAFRVAAAASTVKIPTPEETLIICSSELCKAALNLMERISTTNKSVTTGAVRGAICAAELEWPEYAPKIRAQYIAMVNHSYTEFAPATGSLYRQLKDPLMAAKGQTIEIQRFHRTLYAMNPKNWHVTIIRSSGHYIDATKQREILRRHLGLDGEKQ